MNKYDSYNDNLTEEAEAFDSQIKERVANGHLPDLTHAKDCNYFYNNPWRRKAYVDLDFGEQFKLINASLKKHSSTQDGQLNILEMGCGPGYLSLELARAGHKVTGVDLSDDCIEVALNTAKQHSPELLGTSLNYFCDDFFAKDFFEHFDAIVFLGALHHFPQQQQVHERCIELLKPNGLFVCHEPVRDRVTKGNAIFFSLLTSLLKFTGNYYQNQASLPQGQALKSEVDRVFNQIRYELEDGEKQQSVNDNEAGFSEIQPMLKRYYDELDFQWRYAFFHEVIGGLRLNSEEQNAQLARYLRDMDKLLCEEKVLSPTEFFFIGTPKNSDN
ncbi:class I SAM-dependent methyltransferase [Alteromonas sediminis]|uniref:Class I SAM-dependent methyltransferase n=1 Tax=Alteromonas sediminis TaxID=2259342 RepID=A0A3N5XX07_9ALTE|nr:class I SAM-dependent methyltransferase [Alteromonas sediminis]RPJ64990.1 class I SAM-dependent methyltransferase [Alteromonas sediminis]